MDKEIHAATNKMVKGAIIIGAANLIAKFLGVFFRVPLTNWIGDVGMANYTFAYNIYTVLLMLALAGMPLAISRLVSESIARKEYRNAHKIFNVSLFMMLIIGLAGFLICFFGAGLITKNLGNPDAKYALKAVAPAIIIVPILSSFKGYFQGRQNMNPSAIAQLTEQLIRVISGLILAYILLGKGVEFAAAGGAFGASAGAASGLLIIFIIYLLNKRTIKLKIKHHDQHVEPTRKIAKEILWIAIPIIIGAELMPIMNLIDMSIIMTRLQQTGWEYEAAKALYGLLGGFCVSLIAFPAILSESVAISMVPAIAKAKTEKNIKLMKENIKMGYRTTMIIAVPCMIGIFVLSEQILLLLYPLQREACMKAAQTLMVLVISVLPLALCQTSTGVLQAIGKQGIPVINIFIGCIAKVILTFTLVSMPGLNIKGAAIGTVVADTIAFLLNDIKVRKYTEVKFDFILTYVKPCIAGTIMGVFAFVSYKVISIILPGSIATLCTVILAAIIYIFSCLSIKAVNPDELDRIPGGTKIKKFLPKKMRG